MKYFTTYIYIGILIFTLIISFSCNNQKFTQGAFLYERHCESCHQANGEGLAKLYPPLKNSDYWENNIADVPCIIRNGLKDTILVNGTEYTTQMAGIPSLTEYEISNIMNYINYTWYDSKHKFEIKEIVEGLDKCK